MTPLEPEREDNRELLLVYQGQKEPEVILDGVTTDHGMLMIYHNIIAREADAWLLHKLGLLPDWWRLVNIVRVRHLAEYQDSYTHPEVHAQRRLADLSEPERDALRYGWRVHRTKSGGRITRRVFERKPIQTDPAFEMGLRRVQRRALGPSTPWPNVEVVLVSA